MKSAELKEQLAPVLDYIQEEVNVAEVIVDQAFDSYVQYTCLPNLSVLGKKLGKDMGKVSKAVKAMTKDQIERFLSEKSVTLEGHVLTQEELIVKGSYAPLKEDFLLLDGEDDFCVVLDSRQDEQLKLKGTAREVINRVQKLRKKEGL